MRTVPRSPTPETIAIDDLLVRAYREKRLDRMSVDPRGILGAHGPAQFGGNVLSRGERVDTSAFGATTAARARDTLARIADAGDVLLAAHDLVLCLDDYFVEGSPTDPLGFTLWTKAGALDADLVIVEEDGDRARLYPAEFREEAGARIATPIIGARVRPLHRIVITTLVIRAGRAGEPPFVSPVEIEREAPIMSRHGKRHLGTRVEYVTPLATVRQERAEYAAWHDALSSIAAALAGRADVSVLPPAAVGRPWDVEAAERTVLVRPASSRQRTGRSARLRLNPPATPR